MQKTLLFLLLIESTFVASSGRRPPLTSRLNYITTAPDVVMLQKQFPAQQNLGMR